RESGEVKQGVPYNTRRKKSQKVTAGLGPRYLPFKPKQEGGWPRFEPHPLIPGFPAMAVRNIEHYQNATTLSFDLRIVPGMTEEMVREDMTALLDQIRADDAEFRYELIIPQSANQPNMPARPATPVDSPVVTNLIAAHRRVTGSDPVVGAGHRIGATADTCHFKGVGINCVEYGPGFIPIWPMVDECIDVDQIVTATQVLALTVAEICGCRR